MRWLHHPQQWCSSGAMGACLPPHRALHPQHPHPPQEELVHDAGVRGLMPGLVRGNGAADACQRGVAVVGGQARGVAVADLGGALLRGATAGGQEGEGPGSRAGINRAALAPSVLSAWQLQSLWAKRRHRRGRRGGHAGPLAWNEVYTKHKYGLFSSLGSSPEPMSRWMVVSTERMSTLYGGEGQRQSGE